MIVICRCGLRERGLPGDYDPRRRRRRDADPDGTPAMMKAFNAWGWRFRSSDDLPVADSRSTSACSMNEMPGLHEDEEVGAASKAPLRRGLRPVEKLQDRHHRLFGLVAGQAVVWYSGQFYALFFMQNRDRVDSFTRNVLVAWSLILGTAASSCSEPCRSLLGRKRSPGPAA